MAGSIVTSSLPLDPARQVNGEGNLCLICLCNLDASSSSSSSSSSPPLERALLPLCSHSNFCLPCLQRWIRLKSPDARCPLCNCSVGRYVLYDIRRKQGSDGGDWDYRRWWIGLDQRDEELEKAAAQSVSQERTRRRQRREGRREGDTSTRRRPSASQSEALESQLDRAIEKRRYVYREGLYALHVGSSPHTGLSAPPSPSHFATQPALLSLATPFLHRELLALSGLFPLDIPFLTTYILSILKVMDLRSEGAVKLIAEVIGEADIAEHFTHEFTTFLRWATGSIGRGKKVEDWDRWVSYEVKAAPRAPGENSSGPSSIQPRSQDEADPTSASLTPSSINGQPTEYRNRESPEHDSTDSRDEQSISRFSRSVSPPAAPALRHEVISQRAALLERLSREKQKLGASSSTARSLLLHQESGNGLPSPGDAESTATTVVSTPTGKTPLSAGIDREKLLKKLMLEKARARQAVHEQG